MKAEVERRVKAEFTEHEFRLLNEMLQSSPLQPLQQRDECERLRADIQWLVHSLLNKED